MKKEEANLILLSCQILLKALISIIIYSVMDPIDLSVNLPSIWNMIARTIKPPYWMASAVGIWLWKETVNHVLIKCFFLPHFFSSLIYLMLCSRHFIVKVIVVSINIFNKCTWYQAEIKAGRNERGGSNQYLIWVKMWVYEQTLSDAAIYNSLGPLIVL